MFSQRLRLTLKARGYSLTELSDLLGVKRASLTRWENGTRQPRYEMLVRICDVLEVSSDYLLGREMTSDVPSCEGEHPGAESDPPR